MSAKVSQVRRERRYVDPAGITVRADFQARKGPKDRAHIRTLAQAVKNHGELDPVLLWLDAGALVLLDGAYRLAAYRAAGWSQDIPANVVSCDRRTALLLAAGANSKDRVSLTPQEKADLAWKLVREPGMKFSKREVAEATGVSTATVGRMRSRFRELNGNPEAEITGHWWRDRLDQGTDWEEGEELSEAQRRKAIEEIVKRLRDVLDWRKAGSLTHDSGVVFEALHEALGVEKVRSFVDWAFGGMSEEVDEWSGFAVDEVAGDDDADTDF